MPRVAPLLVVLLALLAGCTNDEDPGETGTTPTGPTTPPPPPSEGSVVANVNDTWRYRGEGNESVTSTVTGANASVVRLTTVSERANATPHRSVTLFDARTLAILSIQDDAIIPGGATLRFDPPLAIVIPAEDHEYAGSMTVQTAFLTFTQPASGSVRFLGGAEVDVPAGSFYAFGYNATFRSEGDFPFAQTIETWFAPEVEQAVKSIRDGRPQELVAFDLSG